MGRCGSFGRRHRGTLILLALVLVLTGAMFESGLRLRPASPYPPPDLSRPSEGEGGEGSSTPDSPIECHCSPDGEDAVQATCRRQRAAAALVASIGCGGAANSGTETEMDATGCWRNVTSESTSSASDGGGGGGVAEGGAAYSDGFEWRPFCPAGPESSVAVAADAAACLAGRSVALVGDSLQRGLYCDLLMWLGHSTPGERRPTGEVAHQPAVDEGDRCVLDRGIEVMSHDALGGAGGVSISFSWATGVTFRSPWPTSWASLERSLKGWTTGGSEAPDVLQVSAGGLWPPCRLFTNGSYPDAGDVVNRFMSSAKELKRLLDAYPLPHTVIHVRGPTHHSAIVSPCHAWTAERQGQMDTTLADLFSEYNYFSVLGVTRPRDREFDPWWDGMHYDPKPRPVVDDTLFGDKWKVMSVSRAMNLVWLQSLCPLKP